MSFKPAEKTFNASAEISSYVRQYYKNIYQAREEGKKIAWVTGITPVELLYAMDIVPIFPENYNALCSAKQLGAELCEVAESHGYSNDTCSYGRVNLGTILSDKAPFGPLPEPDLLICTRNVCGTHYKWWDVLASHFNKPLFVLDSPQIHNQIEKHQAEYFQAQMHDLIKFCEFHTGNTMKEQRLMEVLQLSSRLGELWMEIRNYRKNVPCPISSSDIFGNMFLVVTLPGTQKAVDLMTLLRDEVAERTRGMKGVIEKEKFRLLWDNIAIWYNLGLMNYLEDKGAVSVIETYSCYTGWGETLDLSQGPFPPLTKKYMRGYLNLDLNTKIDLISNIVQEFKIDGVLLFSNRSCKPYSVGQFDIKAALDRINVPSLMFEADMVDPRAFAAATIKNRLDAFIETM